MEENYAKFLIKKTTEDYNLIAKDFSRTRGQIWEEIKFLFQEFLIPGEKILDLGCGNGRWFELFEEYNVEYVGLDSSEKLIEIAQKRYPQAKFQTGDALDLPFPQNFFDKVYSIAVLHQIPSYNFRLKFLQEAKRTLKPGGFLILTVWRFHQKREIFLLFKYTILKLLGESKLDFRDIFDSWGKKAERYYHFFTKRELLNLVQKAGFKIQSADIVKNERGNRQNIYLVAQKM